MASLMSDAQIARLMYGVPPQWVVQLAAFPDAMDRAWNYLGDLTLPTEHLASWVAEHSTLFIGKKAKHTCKLEMRPVKFPEIGTNDKRSAAGVYVGRCAKSGWYVWARCWVRE